MISLIAPEYLARLSVYPAPTVNVPVPEKVAEPVAIVPAFMLTLNTPPLAIPLARYVVPALKLVVKVATFEFQSPKTKEVELATNNVAVLRAFPPNRTVNPILDGLNTIKYVAELFPAGADVVKYEDPLN